MADLTTQTARWCASNDHWTWHTITGWVVQYGPSSGQYARDYTCTCPSFHFRATCKHVDAARENEHHCRYGEGAAWGSPENMGETCPKCGGPTSVVSYAT